MKNRKEIKYYLNNYSYVIEPSEEFGHIAYALEFSSLRVDGKSTEAALKELKSALTGAIEWLQEDGQEIPTPIKDIEYKGNITLRVSPEEHRSLDIKARAEGISMNQYIKKKVI